VIGTRIVIKRGANDEAEKPFWISFADMMTALMVLFLLVMSVALLAVTKTVSETEQKKAEHEQDIQLLLDKVEKAASPFGVTVDRKRQVIDFGDHARFDTGSYQITRDQEKLLRAFVPTVLDIARDDLGKRVLKQIVVEGYTDQRGTYLYNLNLSMQRSQQVLCALLDKPGSDERPLENREKEEVRELFLVGGFSFNSSKPTLEESRRIELRLEFLAVDESRPKADVAQGNFGVCAI
jgi:outer membrane protein OmpA-like peptidoglycan-associated protein